MENKDSKNSFNHPAVIVTVLILIFIGGYFLLNKNSNTPQDNTPNPQQAEIDALKKTVEDLKNAKPKTVIKEVPAPTPISTADIVKEWAPRVVRIFCSDSNYISSGSGVMTRMNFSDRTDVSTLITNKHVVTDPVNGYLYSACNFSIPGLYNLENGQNVSINLTMSNERELKDQDVAYFLAKEGNTKTPPGANTAMKVCSPNDAVIGDKIVVLGYPASGGTGDATAALTVTDGLISSKDGEYYVTNTKIDHGNSGGATILVKNDCYLGIPTWVQSGGFESLGRILPASIVFN